MLEIKTNIEKCVACKICELACSFHHKAAFCPEESSIKIHCGENTKIEISILPTCNCSKELEALCVEFCPRGAIKITGRD